MDPTDLSRRFGPTAAIPAGIVALAWTSWACGLELDYGPEVAVEVPDRSAGRPRQAEPDPDRSRDGDWGISARYRSRPLKTEFNFYWSESRETRLPSPSAATLPPAAPPGDDYSSLYPQGARLLGAGFRTSLRQASLGSDVQLSRSAAFIDTAPAAAADPQDKLNYIASQIVRVRLSAAYSLAPTALWDSATLRVNVGRQRLNSLSRNAVAIDPGANRHSRSIQILFTPSWSEVLPNLDLSLPVSLSYSPKAQTPLPGVTSTYKGSRLSIGASAVYQKAWNADFSYMHYFEESTSPSRDRNFLWLSIRRSF